MTLLFAIGCSKVENPTSEEALVDVRLNIGGEISVETTPITKSTPTNDAYAINVYYNKDNDGLINDIYGYGLFDNTEDMTISLLSGHKYRFECTLVKNAKNVLFYGQAFNNSYTGFAYPFQTNSSNSTKITNEFILGTTTYFTGIKSGNTHLPTAIPSTSNYKGYANVNRLYGEKDNYSPVANGSVTIDLKRVVFGARFVITGVEDGTLTASCGSFWSTTTNKDDGGSESLYTYPNVYDCWKNDSDITANLSLSFKSSIASYFDLSSTTSITFKRNMLTTVNINISPDKSAATLSITEEEIGVVNNIGLYINADGVIDVTIDPNEN